MKTLIVLALLASPALAATYQVPIEADAKQVAAAQYFISLENAKITAENEQRAAQDPPLDPLPTIAGPIQYLTSVLERVLASWVIKHDRITMANSNATARWAASTDAQRAAALAALAEVPNG